MDAGRPDDEPIDSLTSEPVIYGGDRSSVVTWMGEIEPLGDLARGLGASRVKIALVVGGGLALAIALFGAIS